MTPSLYFHHFGRSQGLRIYVGVFLCADKFPARSGFAEKHNMSSCEATKGF